MPASTTQNTGVNQDRERQREVGPSQVIRRKAPQLSTMPDPSRSLTGEERREALNYREIIEPTLQYELYNPSDKEIEFTFDGIVFTIPPFNQRWQGKHPVSGEQLMYSEPGILPIWAPGKGSDGKPARYGAKDIVAFAVGGDGMSSLVVGVLGVRPLFGDQRDELVREDARDAWATRRMEEVDAALLQYEAQVERERSLNRPPRPMPRIVRDMYLWRQANHDTVQAKFTCTICNWPFHDETAVHLHVIATHKNKLKEVAAAEQALKFTGESGGRIESEPKYETELPRGLAGIDSTLDAAAAGLTGNIEQTSEQSSDPTVSALEEKIRREAERKAKKA